MTSPPTGPGRLGSGRRGQSPAPVRLTLDRAAARHARAVRVGAGHGGSHPFLVHEFVGSIAEGRRPLIDAQTAARWTAPGICAHQSALAGGIEVSVPDY